MKEPEIIKEGWVVITPTLCQGDILAWRTEDDEENAIPIVFDSEEDAWKEIADDMITCLQQFVDGERELESTDFGTEEYVVKYKEYNNGTIIAYHPEDNSPIVETTIEKWRESL